MITHVELSSLLFSASLAGAAEAMENFSPIEEIITIAKAYRLCGRSNVDRWLSEKLLILIPLTKGNKLGVSRRELDKVASQNNTVTYLSSTERKGG